MNRQTKPITTPKVSFKLTPPDQDSVEAILQQAILTFEERNAAYGSTYTRFGSIMMILFPKGLVIEDAAGWNRMAILMQIVTKLMRFTADPGNPHLDSIHDMIPYAAMMEELVRTQK